MAWEDLPEEEIPDTCPECIGTGLCYCGGHGVDDNGSECLYCFGSGECPNCWGEGKI